MDSIHLDVKWNIADGDGIVGGEQCGNVKIHKSTCW